MLYVIFFFLTLIIIFIGINVLRKLHWLSVQKNLHDLADNVGGNVLRKGILGRPIYHGRYKNMDITINFSTEKAGKRRVNYLDISIGSPLRKKFTITSLNWLRERGEESVEDFEPISMKNSEYGILKNHKLNIKKESIQELINDLAPFVYVYGGQNGILFEKECQNLAICTQHPKVQEILDSLARLIKMV